MLRRTNRLAIFKPLARTLALALCVLAPAAPAFAGGPLPYDGSMPRPGITIAQFYNIYTSASSYYTAGGTGQGQTGVQTDVPILRLIHTFGSPGGTVWGVQLIQPYFQYLGNTRVHGVDLAHQDGLAETQLSVFVKPYHDAATDSVLTLAYFLSPPSGSFSSDAALNPGTNNWVDNPEIGFTHLLLGRPGQRRLDLQLWADVYYYGSTDGARYGPITGTRHTDRSEQLRVYLPYYIRPQSGGYVGLALEKTWGGAQSISGDVRLRNGALLQVPTTDTGARIDYTRVGIDGGTFLSRTVSLQAQLSTDVQVRGGVRNDVYFLLQISKAF